MMKLGKKKQETLKEYLTDEMLLKTLWQDFNGNLQEIEGITTKAKWEVSQLMLVSWFSGAWEVIEQLFGRKVADDIMLYVFASNYTAGQNRETDADEVENVKEKVKKMMNDVRSRFAGFKPPPDRLN